MRPDVHAALAELKSEIDILAASVVARSRLPKPEILTFRRVSFGSASAAVLTSEPAAAPRLPEPQGAPLSEANIEAQDRIEPPPETASGAMKAGFFQRLAIFIRRVMRFLAG